MTNFDLNVRGIIVWIAPRLNVCHGNEDKCFLKAVNQVCTSGVLNLCAYLATFSCYLRLSFPVVFSIWCPYNSGFCSLNPSSLNKFLGIWLTINVLNVWRGCWPVAIYIQYCVCSSYDQCKKKLLMHRCVIMLISAHISIRCRLLEIMHTLCTACVTWRVFMVTVVIVTKRSGFLKARPQVYISGLLKVFVYLAPFSRNLRLFFTMGFPVQCPKIGVFCRQIPQ